jgi:hypothetical protein
LCPTNSYEIEVVRENQRRGVSFLICSNPRVTAKGAFDGFSWEVERTFLTRFDAWIDWIDHKKYYHGWDQSEFRGKYTTCFVFKAREKQYFHRLYGFLCNPRINYQLCVIITHILKTGWATNESDLKEVMDIRIIPGVQYAIDEYFRRNL